MRFLTAVLITILTQSAFAIPESASYFRDIETKVSPYLASRLKYSSFIAHDGKRIVFATLTQANPRGTIVISPGRTESILGFSEMLYDLAQKGFSLAIIDHRGQGFSDRIVTSSDVGTVGRFADYDKDFAKFVTLTTQRPGPYFLMADSMGSAIALNYLREHPKTFAKALIAVPMLKIKTAPLPYMVASFVANTLWFFGRGETYIPSTGPFDLNRKFSENDFTDSEMRFDLDVRLTAMHPQIAVGGASPNWVIEAMRAGARVRKAAQDISTPMILLQAGNDSYVDNAAEEKFCQTAPVCKLVKFSSAKHWIYYSKDNVRDQILMLIDKSFTKEVRGPRD